MLIHVALAVIDVAVWRFAHVEMRLVSRLCCLCHKHVQVARGEWPDSDARLGWALRDWLLVFA